MNHHFNSKSLIFYGTAIGFVVLLFSLTTAYGEAHVKAPRDIDGRYSIDGEELPGCLKSNRLILDVKQSGVYLGGALLEADASEKVIKAIEQHPPLSGEWKNQQLSLAGLLSHLGSCQGAVAITGTVDQKTLNGTMSLDSSPEKVNFTAQQEKPEPASQAH